MKTEPVLFCLVGVALFWQIFFTGIFESHLDMEFPDGIERGGSRGLITTKMIAWPIGKKGSTHVENIPEGFEFESSVPRWLHWAQSPFDPKFVLSACVHDWLLESGYDKDFSDSQWFAAARKSQAPTAQAKAVRFAMMLRRFWFSSKTYAFIRGFFPSS